MRHETAIVKAFVEKREFTVTGLISHLALKGFLVRWVTAKKVCKDLQEANLVTRKENIYTWNTEIK